MTRQELFDLDKAYKSIKKDNTKFSTDFIFTMERNIKSMETELKGIHSILEEAEKEKNKYLVERHAIAKKYAVLLDDGEPQVEGGSYVFDGDNKEKFLKEVFSLDEEAIKVSKKLDEDIKPLLEEDVDVTLRKHKEITIDLTPEEARALLIVFDE